MLKLLSVTMFSIFISLSPAYSNDGSFIVGGEVVDPTVTNTKYIVSIAGGCGGSIIADKWILTAAHCKSIFGRAITAGGVDLKATNRTKLEIKKFYIHPKYNATKGSNDFALLELKTPIDFSTSNLGMIGLTDPDFAKSGGTAEGIMATVLGWGSMREGGSITSILRKVNVPIVSHQRANAPTSYNGQIDDSMLAAGYDEGNKDSCQGDSGGPLTVMGTDGQELLAGIVSFGEGCARPKYYGIYSNVANGYSWIIATMAQ